MYFVVTSQRNVYQLVYQLDVCIFNISGQRSSEKLWPWVSFIGYDLEFEM